jgi:hypothetical protein
MGLHAPIRHLAASRTGALVAAGEFERNVHVWDIASRKHIRSLETILDFGGRRLAISCDGHLLVAGAYRTGGVACYSIENGNKVWQRPDLRQPQIIHFSNDDNRIIVGDGKGTCRILERERGQTLKELRNVRNIVESAWEPAVFASAKVIEIRTPEYELLSAIPRASFAELDVTFARQYIVISESGGPLRCCETASGREVWRYQQEGRHALRVAYVPAWGTIAAIDWAYERGSNYRLMRFDIGDGRAEIVAEIAPTEVVFCFQGECLLTAAGTMHETETGREVGRLWQCRGDA